MNLDVDSLIDFFKKNTKTESKEEFTEQDAAAPAPSGGGSSVPKWADIYGLKRGKANMLGKKGEKWSSGMTRGVGNQIW